MASDSFVSHEGERLRLPRLSARSLRLFYSISPSLSLFNLSFPLAPSGLLISPPPPLSGPSYGHFSFSQGMGKARAEAKQGPKGRGGVGW